MTPPADDQRPRALLLMIASGATALYLAAAAAATAIAGDAVVAIVAACLAGLAVRTYSVAHHGRLSTAEWSSAALIATSSVALIALHGPISARLGFLLLGVIVLGLAARPWMVIAQTVLAAALLAAVAGLPAIPLSPAATPVWLDVAQQIAFATAILVIFTHGYRRLLYTLAHRTTDLEAAHTELLAARDRLERLVGERTAELELAAADLEAFAGSVAHDLRAPLHHVRHFLGMCADDAAALGEIRLAPIAAVQASAVELTATIEAILAGHRQAAKANRTG